MTKHQAALQYQADDAPFASARTAFESAFTAWYAAREPASQTTSFVTPFVTACTTFEDQLRTQTWPANVRLAVRRFAASLGAIAQDVSSLPSVTASTGVAWAAKLKADSARSVADAKIVRTKVGLAPVG